MQRWSPDGQWSLWVALEGKVRLRTDAAPIDLAPGAVALLAHASLEGTTVEISVAERTLGRPGVVLRASFRDFCTERSKGTAQTCASVHTFTESAGMHSILGLLEAELTRASAGSQRIAWSLAEALFGYVLRASEEAASARGASLLPVVADRQVARALELIHHEPAARWTLEALAKSAGLSRSQFVRRFVAELGVAPLRYLALWRLQLAADELASGDDVLAAIAARVGYDSEFAFSRAFKRHMGEAPGTFRRRMRARHGASVALALAA